MTVVGVIIWEGLLHGSLLILPVLPPGWLASCFKGHSPVEYWLLRFRLEGWGGGDKTDDRTHHGLVPVVLAGSLLSLAWSSSVWHGTHSWARALSLQSCVALPFPPETGTPFLELAGFQDCWSSLSLEGRQHPGGCVGERTRPRDSGPQGHLLARGCGWAASAGPAWDQAVGEAPVDVVLSVRFGTCSLRMEEGGVGGGSHVGPESHHL